LDPLFAIWYAEAIREFGWLGGNPRALGPGAFAHSWDWPKHRVADVKQEADANDTRLKNGSLSLPTLYSECGVDAEDEIVKMAAFYAVEVATMRTILLVTHFPAAAGILQPQKPQPVGDPNGT
jgi:hypothetical protein